MVARSKMREIPVLDDLIASAIDRECHSLLCTVEHDSNGSVLRDACEAYEDFIDFEQMMSLSMQQQKPQGIAGALQDIEKKPPRRTWRH